MKRRDLLKTIILSAGALMTPKFLQAKTPSYDLPGDRNKYFEYLAKPNTDIIPIQSIEERLGE